MVHADWSHNTIFQLVLHGKHNTNDNVNVFNFEATAAREALMTTDALAVTEAGTIVDDWIANLQTAWLAAISLNYTLPRLTCQVVERPGEYEHRLTAVERFPSGPPAGAVSSDASAATPAGVIRWRSTVASRSARGRTFVPAVPENHASSGVADSTQTGLWETFAAAMIARYPAGTTNAGGAQFTVYSRPYDHSYYVKRVAGVPEVIHLTDYAGNSNLITGHAIDPNLRSQRRREIGVGS